MLVTTLASLSLMAFGFLTINSGELEVIEKSQCKAPEQIAQNISDPVDKVYTDFFYDFGPRFNPITKEDLKQARVFSDFVSETDAALVDTYDNVKVVLIKNDYLTDVSETCKGGDLSKKQMNLLHSADYSSNFMIEAEYFRKNDGSSQKKFDYMAPHITIIPETQATYILGKQALLSFIRNGNKENTANLDKDKLQPAMLTFTISKTGYLVDLHLNRTCGFEHIDETMMGLINQLPGNWIPAENAQGEKVEQVFVINFGMVGC